MLPLTKQFVRPVKQVLDTNILVSALLTKNTPPDQLYQAWIRGLFDLVSSDWQLNELKRVLTYPKLRPYILPNEADLLIENLEEHNILPLPREWTDACEQGFRVTVEIRDHRNKATSRDLFREFLKWLVEFCTGRRLGCATPYAPPGAHGRPRPTTDARRGSGQ